MPLVKYYLRTLLELLLLLLYALVLLNGEARPIRASLGSFGHWLSVRGHIGLLVKCKRGRPQRGSGWKPQAEPHPRSHQERVETGKSLENLTCQFVTGTPAGLAEEGDEKSMGGVKGEE